MLHKAFFLSFFLAFFVPLGPLGLILVQHFLKESRNSAMPWSGKNTASE